MDDQTNNQNPMPDPNAPQAPAGAPQGEPMGGQEQPMTPPTGGDMGNPGMGTPEPAEPAAPTEAPAEGGQPGDANQGGSVS